MTKKSETTITRTCGCEERMSSATTMSSVTRMEFTVLNGRMSHICAIIGSSMFMFGGYHKSETDARLKDRDVTVNMADINIYSTTDVSFYCLSDRSGPARPCKSWPSLLLVFIVKFLLYLNIRINSLRQNCVYKWQ